MMIDDWLVTFLCEWEEVAQMLQWKIYHFVDHFRAYKLEI